MPSQLKYNDFEILNLLGAGTVGSISKVRDKRTKKLYALKLLSPGISQNKLIAARFEREILVLSKLDHPNIVSYHGHGEHEQQLFYVMELVDGGTLKSLLETTGPFTWHEAAECGRQLASALQHAHNQGVIHRDLKPGNIFLDQDAHPKLGDFGIAQDQHEAGLTDMGLTVGTYAYMPPELITGERNITGKADLYALGCLLFEMMAGRTPFVGDGFPQLFDQHLNHSPPRLSHFVPTVPAALEELVNALLAKNPEDRPFNARAVQGKLGTMLEPLAGGDAHNSEDTAVTNLGEAQHDDIGAAQTRWGQPAIRHRVQMSNHRRDVSWSTLGVVAALLAAALAVVSFCGFTG